MRQPVQPGASRLWLSLVLVGASAICGLAGPARATAADRESVHAEPAVVIAAAGVDRLLEGVDYVFESAGRGEIAQLVRGFVANFNNLQGVDRSRPIGLYLFAPPREREEPQPVIFVPVADVDQLIASVRFGPLQLKRGETDDRLTLLTEEGEVPVGLAHECAFLDPVGRGRWLDAGLPDPSELVGALLSQHDVGLLIRREGFPDAAVEKVLAQIRKDSAKDAERKPEETDEEYALRRELEGALVRKIEQLVERAVSLSAAFRLSREQRRAELAVHLETPPGGELGALFSSIGGRGSLFADQLADPAPFTVASCWRLTPGGKALFEQFLAIVRTEVHKEAGRGDATIRATAEGVLEALEAHIEDGRFDGFLQIAGGPPNAFALVGAARVADAQAISTGLERFLPFAGESSEVAELEMNAAVHEGIAVHRLKPRKLRRQDQRLYGEGASFFVAAGRGAVWFALGEEDALAALTDAIDRAADAAAIDRAADTAAVDGPPAPDARPLLEVTVHLTSWIGLAPASGSDDKARAAALAREAFADPQQDRFHVKLTPSADGLRLHATVDEGYIRLLGLAVAAQIDRR